VQGASCEFVKENQILVRNLFRFGPLQPGTTIIFTIDNCLLDVNRKSKTDSWEITTLSPEMYPIDRVAQGLSLTFPCNAPCQTCAENNANLCYSCNVLTGISILYNNRCYAQCPERFYLDEYNRCQQCAAPCRTCKKDNPKHCLSCNMLSSTPFLDGTTCTDQCPYGYFKSIGTSKCQLCQAPCESCSGTATNCLTCVDDRQLFLHQNQCLATCPSGFYTPPATSAAQ
jgi:hypothetical protein